MNWRRTMAIALATVVFVSDSRVIAQTPRKPEIYWLHSPQRAASLARQYHLPILVFVESDSCYYCRKMEHDVWSNPQIVEMVEDGFIPLELNAERDEKLVAGMGITALPATTAFTPNAQFIMGQVGYQSTTQVAGLLRAAVRTLTDENRPAQTGASVGGVTRQNAQ